MQVIYPNLLGDLGDQILAAKPSFGIRRPVDGCPGRLERMETAALDLPEFEYISSAELIEELLEFKTISPGIERRLRDALGPGRFSRLTKQLFQVWQTDRMI
jgi:hypothetical protein